MTTEFPPAFSRQYASHLKHLKLKGLQPKTIDAVRYDANTWSNPMRLVVK